MIVDLPVDFHRAVLLGLAALLRSGLDPQTARELVAQTHGLRPADVEAIKRQWAGHAGPVPAE